MPNKKKTAAAVPAVVFKKAYLGDERDFTDASQRADKIKLARTAENEGDGPGRSPNEGGVRGGSLNMFTTAGTLTEGGPFRGAARPQTMAHAPPPTHSATDRNLKTQQNTPPSTHGDNSFEETQKTGWVATAHASALGTAERLNNRDARITQASEANTIGNSNNSEEDPQRHLNAEVNKAGGPTIQKPLQVNKRLGTTRSVSVFSEPTQQEKARVDNDDTPTQNKAFFREHGNQINTQDGNATGRPAPSTVNTSTRQLGKANVTPYTVLNKLTLQTETQTSNTTQCEVCRWYAAPDINITCEAGCNQKQKVNTPESISKTIGSINEVQTDNTPQKTTFDFLTKTGIPSTKQPSTHNYTSIFSNMSCNPDMIFEQVKHKWKDKTVTNPWPYTELKQS